MLGLLGGAAAMAVATGGAASAAPDKAAIEKIVHDYILAHPEILPEAMARLQQRESGRLVADNRAAIETPFAGAWAGARDGDVVLVEFFDYACGYCRQAVPDIERLLAEDKKLKVVFRELPILGAGSEQAAKASLAAAGQGRFLDFHRKMYAAGRPTEASIAKAKSAVGINPGGADAAAVTAEIDKNIGIARALNLTGTPSFIIGDEVLNGAVGYDTLKKVIADARATKAG